MNHVLHQLEAPVAELIHALGNGHTNWMDTLRQSARFMHADSACILWRQRSNRDVLAAESVDIPDATLQVYNLNFADRDCLARKFSHSPAGTRFLTNTEVSKHDTEDHEFLYDFLHPHGVQEIQGFVLDSNPHHVVSLSFLRDSPRSQQSRLQTREKHLFLSLYQAMNLFKERSNQEMHHVASLMQPDTHCWFICTEHANVFNDADNSFQRLRHGGQLYLHNQQLRHQDPLWNQRLQQCLQSVLRDGQASTLLMPDSWGRSYRLHIDIAAERYRYGLAQLLMLRLECRSIFESPSAQMLGDYFSLTPSEAQICQYLLAGMTLKDIAQVNNIASDTVRKHLAAILKKTGCHRQAELQRLLASL